MRRGRLIVRESVKSRQRQPGLIAWLARRAKSTLIGKLRLDRAEIDPGALVGDQAVGEVEDLQEPRPDRPPWPLFVPRGR
jgi:hypothetical protein